MNYPDLSNWKSLAVIGCSVIGIIAFVKLNPDQIENVSMTFVGTFGNCVKLLQED